jgi:hypothetical protein
MDGLSQRSMSRRRRLCGIESLEDRLLLAVALPIVERPATVTPLAALVVAELTEVGARHHASFGTATLRPSNALMSRFASSERGRPDGDAAEDFAEAKAAGPNNAAVDPDQAADETEEQTERQFRQEMVGAVAIWSRPAVERASAPAVELRLETAAADDDNAETAPVVAAAVAVQSPDKAVAGVTDLAFIDEVLNSSTAEIKTGDAAKADGSLEFQTHLKIATVGERTIRPAEPQAAPEAGSLPFELGTLKQGVDRVFELLGQVGEEAAPSCGVVCLTTWTAVAAAVSLELVRRRGGRCDARISGPLLTGCDG